MFEKIMEHKIIALNKLRLYDEILSHDLQYGNLLGKCLLFTQKIMDMIYKYTYMRLFDRWDAQSNPYIEDLRNQQMPCCEELRI
jgi:hypothetical protein